MMYLYCTVTCSTDVEADGDYQSGRPMANSMNTRLVCLGWIVLDCPVGSCGGLSTGFLPFPCLEPPRARTVVWGNRKAQAKSDRAEFRGCRRDPVDLVPSSMVCTGYSSTVYTKYSRAVSTSTGYSAASVDVYIIPIRFMYERPLLHCSVLLHCTTRTTVLHCTTRTLHCTVHTTSHHRPASPQHLHQKCKKALHNNYIHHIPVIRISGHSSNKDGGISININTTPAMGYRPKQPRHHHHHDQVQEQLDP